MHLFFRSVACVVAKTSISCCCNKERAARSLGSSRGRSRQATCRAQIMADTRGSLIVKTTVRAQEASVVDELATKFFGRARVCKEVDNGVG